MHDKPVNIKAEDDFIVASKDSLDVYKRQDERYMLLMFITNTIKGKDAIAMSIKTLLEVFELSLIHIYYFYHQLC